MMFGCKQSVQHSTGSFCMCLGTRFQAKKRIERMSYNATTPQMPRGLPGRSVIVAASAAGDTGQGRCRTRPAGRVRRSRPWSASNTRTCRGRLHPGSCAIRAVRRRWQRRGSSSLRQPDPQPQQRPQHHQGVRADLKSTATSTAFTGACLSESSRIHARAEARERGRRGKVIEIEREGGKGV